MKKRSRSAETQPTMMIHHVREIQLRLLAVVGVLLIGMVVGYLYYEPLFAILKAPLNGPLHYTSPAGSFNFIIKICLVVGVIVALPVAVYNLIMFVQPALMKKVSRFRIYITSLLSLLFAGTGAMFAFLVIIPLALKFFYKFQVDGLVALISADDYLYFVMNVIITFVLIFQLPLIISFIDHITPLPPKKLFKAEKFIIVGSALVGVLVPFALDPTVQLLIASPIIILYNISIGIVLMQRYFRRRAERKAGAEVVEQKAAPPPPVRRQVVAPVLALHVTPAAEAAVVKQSPTRRRLVMQDISSGTTTRHRSQSVHAKALQPKPQAIPPKARLSTPPPRFISDMRPARMSSPRTTLTPPVRSGFTSSRIVEG